MTGQPGTVWLFEPLGIGHHFAYAALVADRIATDDAVPVVLVTADAYGTPAFAPYQVHLAPLVAAGALQVRTFSELGAPSVAAALRAVYRTAGADDRVVVLDADRLLVGLALLNTVRPRRRGGLRLLLMRPVLQERGPAARARYGVKLAAARVLARSGGEQTVAVLGIPGRDARRYWPPGTAEVEDPTLIRPAALDPRAARAELALPAERPVLGMLGCLAPRKNAGVAAEATQLLARRSGAEPVLFVAGPCEPAALAELTTRWSSSIDIVVRDSYLSDEQFSRAMQACDVLLCLYDNEGSSGIVNAAVAHGVPVVAAGSASIRAAVTALGAGRSCALTPEGVAAAVDATLHHPTEPQPTEPQPAEPQPTGPSGRTATSSPPAPGGTDTLVGWVRSALPRRTTARVEA